MALPRGSTHLANLADLRIGVKQCIPGLGGLSVLERQLRNLITN